MSNDDKPKVTPLTKPADPNDPVTTLAEALCSVVAEHQHTSPEERLLGIELCARATIEALEHVFGVTELNSIIVEVNRRSKTYTTKWKSWTEEKVIRQEAEVVPLRPRALEKGDDGNNQGPDP